MDKLRPSIFKRLLALLLDFLILGIIGFVLGLFLEDFFVAMGKYGTLFGSSIAIIYFSILQSKLGNGQTLGKRAIGAKVTGLNGEYLTLRSSMLRSFITFFPIMNAGIFSSGKGMLPILMLLLLSMLASIYLIFVNKSRRCLHDILVSSVVTNDTASEFKIDELNDRSTRKLIPIGVVAVLMISTGIYQTFAENTLSQLLAARERIEAFPGVISVDQVKSGTSTVSSMDELISSTSFVAITVRIDDKNEVSNSDSKYFKDFYKIIMAEIPESHSVDVVSITLYYGYNIGIASKTNSMTKRFKQGAEMAYWQKGSFILEEALIAGK